MLPRPIVSRLGWFIFCFALITTAVIIISRPTATASVTTTEFDLSHIDIVAHLNVSGTTELERLLATNPANLGSLPPTCLEPRHTMAAGLLLT